MLSVASVANMIEAVPSAGVEGREERRAVEERKHDVVSNCEERLILFSSRNYPASIERRSPFRASIYL